MIGVGAALLLLAVLLWGLASWQQRRTGLPYARVRYDDASRGERVEKPLVSHRYRLTGRPDFLLEQRGQLIPVEVKPTRRAAEPYQSDLMQLMAYCLLVEEQSGQRPSHGLLRYASGTWRVPYSPAARQQLLDTLDAMNEAQQSGDVARNHQQPARCAACSQRLACDQSLA